MRTHVRLAVKPSRPDVELIGRRNATPRPPAATSSSLRERRMLQNRPRCRVPCGRRVTASPGARGYARAVGASLTTADRDDAVVALLASARSRAGQADDADGLHVGACRPLSPLGA